MRYLGSMDYVLVIDCNLVKCTVQQWYGRSSTKITSSQRLFCAHYDTACSCARDPLDTLGYILVHVYINTTSLWVLSRYTKYLDNTFAIISEIIYLTRERPSHMVLSSCETQISIIMAPLSAIHFR